MLFKYKTDALKQGLARFALMKYEYISVKGHQHVENKSTRKLKRILKAIYIRSLITHIDQTVYVLVFVYVIFVSMCFYVYVYMCVKQGCMCTDTVIASFRWLSLQAFTSAHGIALLLTAAPGGWRFYGLLSSTPHPTSVLKFTSRAVNISFMSSLSEMMDELPLRKPFQLPIYYFTF